MSAMLVFYKLFVSCCLLFTVISYGNCGLNIPPKCPQNEIYVKCVNKCNNCNDKGNCWDKKKCEPGCDCLPGFLRNDKGDCVLEKDCNEPPKCPKNETYVKCVNICNTCKDKGDCWPKPPCFPGCDCLPGYFRDNKGNCILEKDCPQPPKCPKNETYVKCVNICNTCKDKGDCWPKPPCFPGCDCLPGYFRDNNGKCILAKDCPGPPKCPPNEIFVNCVNICNTCKDKGNCWPKPPCFPGCDCLPGYFRDNKGKCIPAKDCPGTVPHCDPDEEYRVCSCEQYCCDKRTQKECRKKCRSGCFCRKGLFRDYRGNCVRIEDCPGGEVCDPKTSYYSDCIKCYASCDRPDPICPKDCKSGCACYPGFVYDDFGNCIKREDCPKVPPPCGVFQEYKPCGPACPPTCANRKPDCVGCKPGCFCIPGYIREKVGGCCIPEWACP